MSQRSEIIHHPGGHDYDGGGGLLADEHGWSSSVPNLSGKLRRGSLRYTEAVELADVLGYDLVWQKRRETM